ncbi:MAG: STAS domain-containing protein [Actinomycetota bacterium]
MTGEMGALGLISRPRLVAFFMGGSISRAEIPGLCDRVRIWLENSASEQLVCDVEALVEPDAVAVDALARLQLTARRCGSKVRVRNAREDLQQLIALMGLSDVVPVSPDLSVEPGRQPEEREERGGVEEEIDPADPPVRDLEDL